MKIGRRCRRIKWWFQRANGNVTPPEWWDYKYNLAGFIRQGIEGLLTDGVIDWDNPCEKELKQDLEFILEWARDFPDYESAVVVTDKDDDIGKHWLKRENYFLVITMDEAKEFDKRTEKAFKLLAKNIHSLWD